jgi:hypothetical protein
MRARFLLALLTSTSAAATSALAATDESYAHIASVGLITLAGPTGLFQNPTSGILPKNAFSMESCMAFRENRGDHFQWNGVLATYGVTDWLEISGFGLFIHGLDETVNGDSSFEVGSFNARARVVRESDVLPEVSVGGIAGFGDEERAAHSVFLSASKGFVLGGDEVLRGLRLHGGLRHIWAERDVDVTTGFAGLEIEVIRSIFLIGEVNTRDKDVEQTPWSAGLQYKSKSFGLSASVLQAPNDSEETYYVGIGVSY